MIMNKEKAEKKTPPSPQNLKKRSLSFTEPLLFQFAFHECLLSLKSLRSSLPSQQLSFLLGESHPSQIFLPPIYQKNGSLQKLRGYLTLLSLYFPEKNSLKDPLFLSLTKSVEKTILSAKSYREAIENGHPQTKLLISLKRASKRMTRLLMQRVKFYLDDENVLFFFLRNNLEIDLAFGKHSLERLFLDLFKEGIKEVEERLVFRYKSRKFDHILPLIEGYIEALKKRSTK